MRKTALKASQFRDPNFPPSCCFLAGCADPLCHDWLRFAHFLAASSSTAGIFLMDSGNCLLRIAVVSTRSCPKLRSARQLLRHQAGRLRPISRGRPLDRKLLAVGGDAAENLTEPGLNWGIAGRRCGAPGGAGHGGPAGWADACGAAAQSRSLLKAKSTKAGLAAFFTTVFSSTPTSRPRITRGQ